MNEICEVLATIIIQVENKAEPEREDEGVNKREDEYDYCDIEEGMTPPHNSGTPRFSENEGHEKFFDQGVSAWLLQNADVGHDDFILPDSKDILLS